MSLERELNRAMKDAQDRFPMVTDGKGEPQKANQHGIVLQRWSLIIIEALRREISHDPDLIRELGFEPANLFDQDGEPIEAYVHVL